MMLSRSAVDAALASGDASDVVAVLLSLFPQGPVASPPSNTARDTMHHLLHSIFPGAESATGGSQLHSLVAAQVALRHSYPREHSRAAPVAGTQPDAREVLLFMLQSGYGTPFPTLGMECLSVFLGIILRAYRQLVLDNVRRKCASCAALGTGNSGHPSAEVMRGLVAGVATSMKAWGRDVLAFISDCVLPLLLCRDVGSQLETLSTATDGTAHGGPRVGPAGPREGFSVRGDLIAHVTGNLWTLLTEVKQTTPLASSCDKCAVALYAAAFGTQPFSRGALLLTAHAGAETREVVFPDVQSRLAALGLGIANEAGEMSVMQREAPNAGVTQTAASSWHQQVHHALCVRSPTSTAGKGKLATLLSLMYRLRSRLEDLQAVEEEEDVDATGNASSSRPALLDSEEFLFEEWERGLPQNACKDAVLRLERDAALREQMIWPRTHPLRPSCVRTGVPLSTEVLTLALCGVVSLIFSELFQAQEASLIVSNTPTSTFFLLFDALSAGLRTESATLAFSMLLMTAAFAEAIPEYSLCFPEGAAGGQTDRPSTGPAETARRLPAPHQEGLRVTRTRRNAAFFNLVKQLITLSTMCPSEPHRVLSRRLVIDLLQLLEERSRVRLQCALVCLTPFPSVARFLLDDLAKQMHEHLKEGSRDGAAKSNETSAPLSDTHSVFEEEVPTQLVEASQAFLAKVKCGDAQFAEPLIAALNFFRVILVAGSRNPRRCVMQDGHGNNGLKTQATGRGFVKSAWPEALLMLKSVVLPASRELCTQEETRDDGSAPPRDGLAALRGHLTPLDAFSLATVVSALTASLGA